MSVLYVTNPPRWESCADHLKSATWIKRSESTLAAWKNISGNGMFPIMEDKGRPERNRIESDIRATLALSQYKAALAKEEALGLHK
jgi:hypothetical protein